MVNAGTAITITSTWNVDITVQPQDTGDGASWVKFNGNNGTAAVQPGADFTISADVNNTGASRQVNMVIATTNTRITPPLANQTITIIQA